MQTMVSDTTPLRASWITNVESSNSGENYNKQYKHSRSLSWTYYGGSFLLSYIKRLKHCDKKSGIPLIIAIKWYGRHGYHFDNGFLVWKFLLFVRVNHAKRFRLLFAVAVLFIRFQMYYGCYDTNSNTRHTCPQPEEPTVWIGILSWQVFFSAHISLYDYWNADTVLRLIVAVDALTLVGGNAVSIETGGITNWVAAVSHE